MYVYIYIYIYIYIFSRIPLKLLSQDFEKVVDRTISLYNKRKTKTEEKKKQKRT